MFQGFTQQTVDFMWGIRFNNDRVWFEAHKQDYQEHLYRPMKELCAQVYEALGEEAARYGLKHKVCRIYRDARRLHGQGPYKDHLWWSFEKPCDGDFSAQPVFWFELAPGGWSYGLGYYAARASTMVKHRARVDRDPKPLLALAGKLAEQNEFVLDGPAYAREKSCPVPELSEWYNKKSFSLIHEQSPLDEEIYSPALADRLTRGFRFLLPFYDYFVTLDGDGDVPPKQAHEAPVLP